MLIRIFDIFFSAIALLILSPLLIPVIFILRFSGEGEIFFVQSRVGLNGRRFGLLKFVTMLKNSPNLATGMVTVKDDPRVLPFGKFLRKSKINELPQIINILKGDMSVIGPRPQTDRCFFVFPKTSQDAIIQVRPGLSGIGSIIFRDEESMLEEHLGDRLNYYDNVIAPYKGELEQWYVKHRNLYIYFMLICLTVWVVIFPKSKMYYQIFKDLPQPPKELIL